MIKIGSLFSGIGGFELGLERAIPGAETIWQVEQDSFCQKILKKHWPDAIIFDDVKQVGKHNLEPVDILCGGFPCQDISIAGKGKGIYEGQKSSLWWEMHRIISEIRPRIVVLENVPAINFRGLDGVLGSLFEIGYDAEWCIISARDFGAPHLRKRWFCVAYPNGKRSRQTRNGGIASPIGTGEEVLGWRSPHHQERNATKDQQQWSFGRHGLGSVGETPPHAHNESVCHVNKSKITMEEKRGSQQWSALRDSCSPKNRDNQRGGYWERFPTQPPLCNRNDGVSNRLARLRALGNAIVPQCSEYIGKCILQSGLLEDLK